MTTVDIILFCYKQEQYIEQALRSIYAQKLPKDVSARIIVADDCSPDDTLNIIKHHASESPFPMEFLPEEPNMGISKNYKRSFAATTADYVAILEGDDYWLPNHLMQHMQFWQTQPCNSMMMSRITYLQMNTDGSECILPISCWPYTDSPYSLAVRQQIIGGNKLGNLSACTFRGKLLRSLPESLFDMPIADWMIGMMVAEHAPIALIKESSSVYRIKSDGVWAGSSKWQQHIDMIKEADMYDKYQKGKYHAEWKEFKRHCWQDVRRNWMHYMPEWLQQIHQKLKRK